MPSAMLPEQDDDPVLTTYDIYIKPGLDTKQLYIMQFPNRNTSHHYSAQQDALPLELRVKPKSGLLELDVPVDVWRNYDRHKGHKWGAALQKTNVGVSHGLPGGFGIGSTGVRGRGREEDEEDQRDHVHHNFARAVDEKKVLTKQTLGGMVVPKEPANPRYFIGAFKGDQLHLTPVDQIVQMRPQFHHIDAAADAERQARARENIAAARSGGATAGEARAIHMTVKSHGDEEETTDTMAERIRSAQDEKWRKLHYVDEDSEEAWAAFAQDLFVHGRNDEDDVKSLPKLQSQLKNPAYLDAISAPRDRARLSRSKQLQRNRTKKEDPEKSASIVEPGTESDSSDDSEIEAT